MINRIKNLKNRFNYFFGFDNRYLVNTIIVAVFLITLITIAAVM